MISIIVPIYQAELYIERCVKSIMKQTYSNLEILLVDDGSTDKSLSICRKLEKIDERIKIVHTDNLGGAHARNIGLNIACGEYIAFVDADDFLHPRMYEVLMDLLYRYDCDIAECDYEITDNEDNFKLDTEYNPIINVFGTKDAFYFHVKEKMFKQVVWNKLYKRDVLSDIYFIEGKTIDDEFWTYRVIANAKKLVHTSEKLYCYWQNCGSIMHQNFSLKWLQALEAQCYRTDLIKEKFPDLYENTVYDLIFHCAFLEQMSQLYLSKEDYKYAHKFIMNVLKKYSRFKWKIPSKSMSNRVWYCLFFINFSLTCRIRTTLKVGF